jgi:hypothetical protein
MWHVENTPMWQVVVHGEMDSKFADGINLTIKENS